MQITAPQNIDAQNIFVIIGTLLRITQRIDGKFTVL